MSSPDASRSLAVAVDLGTTTIAASLLDTVSGEILAREGGMNPQRPYGSDVISRLEYACRGEAERRTLSRLVNAELERLIEELLSRSGLPATAVTQVVIAANPTMSHLLLDLPVESLAFPPYRPRVTSSHRVPARSLGWGLDVPLYVFPSPGGFVGGDLVAFLHGLGVRGARTDAGEGGRREDQSPVTSHQSRLFLDLGTNGEIALLAGGRLYATSAAAGPAFEGGNLACGMAALDGAIRSVRMAGSRLVWETIGDGTPRGLCGSGVLDTMMLLLTERVVDVTGQLLLPAEVRTNLANRIVELGGESAFVVYRDAASMVYLSQGDIRQVQLAKAAIRAGIDVLLDRAGIEAADLAEVVLTGSFGVSLNPVGLKSVGIFTENMVQVARFVTEGALAGVEETLRSASCAAVEQLAASLTIIPLSGNPVFERRFLAEMNFPRLEPV
ncbi:ASKHA domain-containing protein [Geobacter argillaceus]|uniref:Uncharacterized protein DUF4445 n=1 Tax=Geobacter argillaceus TaxID=345631 RepID=A0A562WTB7_9BACT|nr:ASKHA domain-containing protein [Geobacter argillaceus]TWJ33066.1 uncharacterized protein DUF4445 [Geobacter argillaceus]